MPGRRAFLRQSFMLAGAIGLSGVLASGSLAAALPDAGARGPRWPWPGRRSPFASFSALQPADANGVMLPYGFGSRIVARSGMRCAPSPYLWHGAPDGGATFATPGGGWVYVSNAELDDGMGGVGALRFDRRGVPVDAYPILEGTTSNCAGGPTPWNTWLSCEEHASGMVWECDPFVRCGRGNGWRPDGGEARSLPALGLFAHEAVAVDPYRAALYMTEDAGASGGGRIYRFACAHGDWPQGRRRPKLRRGRLQVLRVKGMPDDVDLSSPGYASTIDFGVPQPVEWVDALQPDRPQQAVRDSHRAAGRVPPGQHFPKAEGMWFHDGIVYFVTSFNYRIWAYDTNHETLELIYDGKQGDPAKHSIDEPDNLIVSPLGDILVAEDSGNLEIGVLRMDDGSSQPLMRLVGHDDSEVTGLALSPDGRRLYFSSQRGTTGENDGGVTFEVMLPSAAR
ncbi:hypothetical protein ASG87_02650 [Frateuria sp. Soil773]|nr:hypothetical protein ASG87_02650 [Frateuria sp. Soil773]